MYIRIVTFRLDGADEAQYRQTAAEAAPVFAQWPGLRAKLWIADRASATYGGVYLFDSTADADRSRGPELFAAMAANPAFPEMSVREFDVLPELSAVTAGSILRSSPEGRAART